MSAAAEQDRQRLLAEARELLARARALGLEAELAALWRPAGAAAAGAAGPAASRPAPQPGASAGESPWPGRFGMLGDSPPMQKVYALLERLTQADVPVLIQGETGTGKELVARALHEHGRRRGKRFVAVNCAAVPANLLESELFGHQKGAFTGAIADRPGQFVVADGGTLFLDEIGDMPHDMQAKLLRALQEGEVRPVGSNRTQKVDVRVVAASHKDLTALVREGRFRQDLYYRLNVVAIELPPLRQRGADLPLLIRAFLERLARQQGRPVPELSERALAALVAHRWPGNVRELENELSRALALGGERLDLEDLSPAVRA